MGRSRRYRVPEPGLDREVARGIWVFSVSTFSLVLWVLCSSFVFLLVLILVEVAGLLYVLRRLRQEEGIKQQGTRVVIGILLRLRQLAGPVYLGAYGGVALAYLGFNEQIGEFAKDHAGLITVVGVSLVVMGPVEILLGGKLASKLAGVPDG